MATEKQITYIQSLMQGKGAAELKDAGMTMAERAGDFRNTSVKHASDIIDGLK